MRDKSPKRPTRDPSATKAAKSQEAPAKEAGGERGQSFVDRLHLAHDTLKEFLSKAPTSKNPEALSSRYAPRLKKALRNLLKSTKDRGLIESTFTRKVVRLAESDDEDAFCLQMSKMGSRAKNEARQHGLRIHNVHLPESSSMKRARLEEEARRQEEEDSRLVFAEDAEMLELYETLAVGLSTAQTRLGPHFADFIPRGSDLSVRRRTLDRLFDLIEPIAKAEAAGKTSRKSALWLALDAAIGGLLPAAARSQAEFLERAMRCRALVQNDAKARFDHILAIAMEHAAHRKRVHPPATDELAEAAPPSRRVLTRSIHGEFHFAGVPLDLRPAEQEELESLWSLWESKPGGKKPRTDTLNQKRQDRIRVALRAAGANRSLVEETDEAALVLWKGRLFPDPRTNPIFQARNVVLGS